MVRMKTEQQKESLEQFSERRRIRKEVEELLGRPKATMEEKKLFMKFEEMGWGEAQLVFVKSDSWKLHGDCGKCEGVGELHIYDAIHEGDLGDCPECFGDGRAPTEYYDNKGLEKLIKQYLGIEPW